MACHNLVLLNDVHILKFGSNNSTNSCVMVNIHQNFHNYQHLSCHSLSIPSFSLDKVFGNSAALERFHIFLQVDSYTLFSKMEHNLLQAAFDQHYHIRFLEQVDIL